MTMYIFPDICQQKERDLELAARIGQTLLDRTKELENKNAEYEVQLTEANDKVCFRSHDLGAPIRNI
jgi:hypothetical protein